MLKDSPSHELTALHKPVLAETVIQILKPLPKCWFLDCTLGQGGHAEKILEKIYPEGGVIGIDCDRESLVGAVKRLERFGPLLQTFHFNFADIPGLFDSPSRTAAVQESVASQLLEKIKAIGGFDGVLLDLGVSSLHLRTPERGFSFSTDGPLDMRFDRSGGRTAADIVNSLPACELEKIIRNFGEERFARRIAKAIVAARRTSKISRTLEFARIVESAIPPHCRRGRIHAATRTFQALRIAVNNELENLRLFLDFMPRLLKPTGRAVVLSFHSLEDRIVKNYFRNASRAGLFQILTKKPIRPSNEEISMNPAARSAKLRAAVLLEQPS